MPSLYAIRFGTHRRFTRSPMIRRSHRTGCAADSNAGGRSGLPCRPVFGPVPLRPALRGTDRDLEPFGRATVAPAVVDDALGQCQTALGREKSIRVGQEDLSGDECGL